MREVIKYTPVTVTDRWLELGKLDSTIKLAYGSYAKGSTFPGARGHMPLEFAVGP